jgi:hypothetical protein
VAEKAELEITIGPDGSVRIETHGLKGQACLAETKGLEEALGTVRSREKTREFYVPDEQARAKARQR